MRQVPSWYEYFITMANLIKTRSKDRSTQVGVVLVGPDMQILGAGYNGFPFGIEEINDRHERPEKYLWTEHAERNACLLAARHGIQLRHSTMFFDNRPYPCADCARAIVQAGISYVIGRDIPFEGKGDWVHSMDVGKQILIEGGVRILLLNEDFTTLKFEGDWPSELIVCMKTSEHLGENLNHYKMEKMCESRTRA